MCTRTELCHMARWPDTVGNHRPSKYPAVRASRYAAQNEFCRKTNSHNLDACNESESDALCSHNEDTCSPR